MTSYCLDSDNDITDLQRDVDKILQWITSNGLTQNAAKTQLHPLTWSRHPLDIKISIDNRPIPPSSTVKYLSVMLSSDLTWSNNICKKSKRQLGSHPP